MLSYTSIAKDAWRRLTTGAIDRAIYDSLGDEQNLERVITETALLHECAESISIAEWNRDPALKAAFVEDLERHGECRALQLHR